MGNLPSLVASSGKKYHWISRAIRFTPLVECKVKRLYIGISKEIIVARRRAAPPLVVCKHPYSREDIGFYSAVLYLK